MDLNQQEKFSPSLGDEDLRHCLTCQLLFSQLWKYRQTVTWGCVLISLEEEGGTVKKICACWQAFEKPKSTLTLLVLSTGQTHYTAADFLLIVKDSTRTQMKARVHLTLFFQVTFHNLSQLLSMSRKSSSPSRQEITQGLEYK